MKLVSSSSFDESLPETTTVTLNHHQHDVSDSTTPVDRRSVDDNNDSLALPSSSGHVTSSLQQTPDLTTSQTFSSTEDKAKDLSSLPAVYAVPSKPPRRPDTGSGAGVDVWNERGGRTEQRRPPKAVKTRRTANGGVRVGQSRPSTATSGGSRPKIPLEYLYGSTQQASTVDAQEADDDLGFTDVINIARANGYGESGDQHGKASEVEISRSKPNHRSEAILPPPDVFSDAESNVFRNGRQSQPNGHVKLTNNSQGSNSLVSSGAVAEAVYSEVVDVTRSGPSSGDNWDRKSRTVGERGKLVPRDTNNHLDSHHSNGTAMTVSFILIMWKLAFHYEDRQMVLRPRPKYWYVID